LPESANPPAIVRQALARPPAGPPQSKNRWDDYLFVETVFVDAGAGAVDVGVSLLQPTNTTELTNPRRTKLNNFFMRQSIPAEPFKGNQERV
jgi:hypothetical protein